MDSKKTLPILIAQLRSADFLKFDMGKVYMMLGFAILPVIVVTLIFLSFPLFVVYFLSNAHIYFIGHFFI